MSKLIILAVPVALLIFLFFLVSGNPSSSQQTGSVEGTTMQGDTQVIEILAKGGYTPRIINAKSNTKTTLKIKTQNTYDCSVALIIRNLNVNETLPTNGTKSYTIEPQKPGSEIIGNCSMGMYGFKIKFI